MIIAVDLGRKATKQTNKVHAQLSSGARGPIVGLVSHLSFFSLHALSDFRGKKCSLIHKTSVYVIVILYY